MSLAIVALSGGLDSSVAAAVAHKDGHDLALLHADYGQLTEERERTAFYQLADHFGVSPELRLVVPIESLKLIGGSSLTDASIPMESGDLARTSVPNTYVPFRNAHLLSACVSWAEIIKACHIYVGFVEDDSSGYPDCTLDFLKAFESAAHFGTLPETKIKLHAPLARKTKAEIIKLGTSLNVPLHLTWSCYRSETVPCGTCDSCLLRQRGFEQSLEL